MPKKYHGIDPNQPASYKQSWAVGYHFAKTTKEVFPQFTVKKLANLIKGAIYYYHKNKSEILTHGMVQEYLESDNPLPNFYLEHLNQYLKENNIEGDRKPSGDIEKIIPDSAEW